MAQKFKLEFTMDGAEFHPEDQFDIDPQAVAAALRRAADKVESKGNPLLYNTVLLSANGSTIGHFYGIEE